MLSPLFCLMYLQDNLKIHSSLNIRLYRETPHFARSFYRKFPIYRLFISCFSVSYPLMPVIRSSAASFNSIAFLSYKGGYTTSSSIFVPFLPFPTFRFEILTFSSEKCVWISTTFHNPYRSFLRKPWIGSAVRKEVL